VHFIEERISSCMACLFGRPLEWQCEFHEADDRQGTCSRRIQNIIFLALIAHSKHLPSSFIAPILPNRSLINLFARMPDQRSGTMSGKSRQHQSQLQVSAVSLLVPVCDHIRKISPSEAHLCESVIYAFFYIGNMFQLDIPRTYVASYLVSTPNECPLYHNCSRQVRNAIMNPKKESRRTCGTRSREQRPSSLSSIWGSTSQTESSAEHYRLGRLSSR
jgi:hypothetical protein